MARVINDSELTRVLFQSQSHSQSQGKLLSRSQGQDQDRALMVQSVGPRSPFGFPRKHKLIETSSAARTPSPSSLDPGPSPGSNLVPQRFVDLFIHLASVHSAIPASMYDISEGGCRPVLCTNSTRTSKKRR